jgi:hypothetical protein
MPKNAPAYTQKTAIIFTKRPIVPEIPWKLPKIHGVCQEFSPITRRPKVTPAAFGWPYQHLGQLRHALVHFAALLQPPAVGPEVEIESELKKQFIIL